jgi:hypothetical protein
LIQRNAVPAAGTASHGARAKIGSIEAVFAPRLPLRDAK